MTTRIEDISISSFERVVSVLNEEVGLHGYIAIHNTKLGPGLGGIRYKPYSSNEEALQDVLELAHAMTLKSSLAGINFGGGKGVILAPEDRNRVEIYAAFGEAVEQLNGMYIAVGDVGTTMDDLKEVQKSTTFCAGTENDSGIPTAEGLFHAISAYCEIYNINLEDLSVALSGLGKVGFHLAKLLKEQQVFLTLCDILQDVRQQFNTLSEEKGWAPSQWVSPSELHRTPCEVYSPCSLGHVLNRVSRKELNCNAIIGSANNQLEDLETARWLHNHGTLYLPDFLVNAGGVIAIAMEIENTMEELDERLIGIGERVFEVITNDVGLSALDMARSIAWERIESA